MLKSMTGFGKASGKVQETTVNIEIKSLNSQKGLDLSLKLPSKYRDHEYALRNQVSALLQRGKVDVSIYLENNKASSELTLNRELIKSYFTELKSIADEVGASSDQLLPVIMRLPDVTGESHDETNDEEWNEIERILTQAVQELDKFRTNEGKGIETDLLLRLSNIESFREKLMAEDPRRVAGVRERLQNNLEQFISKEKVDQNRFEQEVIFYIEKLDVNEEFSRLKSHCDFFRALLAEKDDLKGRKINFIAQELGREINTIGSKANDAEMQKLVVNMKDELEKIKEQTGNIL